MATFSFNAEQVAPQQSFTPLPAGVYTVVAIESEIKSTRNGGQMAVFTLQVVDGQYANRRVWARFNVANASAEAERIGQSQLSAFCRAAGVMHMTDTVQLHNKPVRAKLKVRRDETYDDSNDVVGFEPVGGPTAPGAPTPSGPSPAAGAATPPWQRKAA